MRRLIILVLAIGLTVFITAETMPCPTAMRHRVGHGVAQSPQRPDILVVDFTKKPSANPYQELYEKLLYPTVRIQAGFSTGSGVVIGDYILTAAHVVNDQSEVTIEVFYPALCELGAFVVITDTDKDLALIKPSRVLPYKAQLAPESYTPYIFTPVYTVGCSLGLTPRPSQGIITYIGDNLRASLPAEASAQAGASHWEVSSPILPGNSGGPVYDARTYQVIGIAVWVHTYNNQIVTTMAGIVPVQSIHEFLATDYTD